MEYVSRAVSW